VTILGSSKADTLVGTVGNDIIIGNGGNDKITGGPGADGLTGGSGNVTFIYNWAADSTPSHPDTITDFTHNHDLIDLTNIAGINSQHGVPTFQGKLAGNLVLNPHSIGYIEVGNNTDVLVNTSSSPETVTPTNVTPANMEIILVGINLHLGSGDFHHA
jgi:Ca2+-binding RTX toxin-like protein